MASRFIVPLGGRGDPLLSVYREMNRMFDDIFTGTGSPAGGRAGNQMAVPSLDVQEKDGQLNIAVELPGVLGEDVDVRLDRDILTISGEKKNEHDQKQSNFHVMERSYGRFSRALQLPFMPDPNQVSAEFEHGVLKIRLQRTAQQQSSRRIEVRTVDPQNSRLGQTGSAAQPAAAAGPGAGGKSAGEAASGQSPAGNVGSSAGNGTGAGGQHGAGAAAPG